MIKILEPDEYFFSFLDASSVFLTCLHPGLSVRPSVRRSVRLLVRSSVGPSSKTTEIDQISNRGGLLGLLDASLYKRVCLSVALSVHRFSVNINENQLQVKVGGIKKESRVITSSCNYSINQERASMAL